MQHATRRAGSGHPGWWGARVPWSDAIAHAHASALDRHVHRENVCMHSRIQMHLQFIINVNPTQLQQLMQAAGCQTWPAYVVQRMELEMICSSVDGTYCEPSYTAHQSLIATAEVGTGPGPNLHHIMITCTSLHFTRSRNRCRSRVFPTHVYSIAAYLPLSLCRTPAPPRATATRRWARFAPPASIA